MIRDMLEAGPAGWLCLLLIAAGIALVPVMIYIGIEDGRRWGEFKVAHACRIVGRMSGDLVTTVAPVVGGSGGVAVGMSVTPDKTGWACDDGMTYWR